MPNTTVTANTIDQWDEAFFMEWNRENPFSRYTGKSVNSIIQVTEKLTRLPGDDITQSLVTRLSGSGVIGDEELETNEEAVGNYAYKHTVDQFRHAIRIGHHEQSKTHIDMLKAATPLLKDWRMNKHRDDIIAALLRMNVDGSTNYSSTSEADRDTFAAANDGTVGRILYGSAVGNASGDNSVDIAKVDSTNDTLDSGIISLAKRLVRKADPHMRPVQVKGFGEYYVAFVGSLGMRDLKADSVISNASQYAMPRGSNNPLFTDSDVIWDGVIVHEIPEIDVLSSVGYSSIDVEPWVLCGAQALGYAVGERAHSISDEFDYGNLKGKGIAETSVVNQLIYNNVSHGVLHGFVSGVADS